MSDRPLDNGPSVSSSAQSATEDLTTAAIDYVESLTVMPIPGVPSREQPWVQARTRLVEAVETYRLALDQQQAERTEDV